MRKRCLIGLVGLPRTFKQTSKLLHKYLITPNSQDWEFDVAVNTDSQCTELVSRQGRASTTERFDEDELNQICEGLYDSDSSTFLGVSFYNHKERHVSGYEVFKRRVRILLDKFPGYDVYVFMRLDTAFTAPIELREFQTTSAKNLLSDENSGKEEVFELFSIVSGGSRNKNRMDHCRDWDYCWIGSERGVRIFIDDEPSSQPREYNLELLEGIAAQTGLVSQYIVRSKMAGELLEHWVEDLLWRRVFRMYENRILVSVHTEKKDIYCTLVRKAPDWRSRIADKGKAAGKRLLQKTLTHEGLVKALVQVSREAKAVLAHRRGVKKCQELTLDDDLKLNLGCGRDIKRGWLNVDLYHPNADVHLDLRQALPFPDESCSRIYLKHVLECFDYPNKTASLLEECLRLLKPGGRIELGVVDAEWPTKEYAGVRRDGYFDIALETLHPDWCHTKMEHLNYHFRESGKRQFVFDFETLEKLLSEIGFEGVERREFDHRIDSGTTRAETLFVTAVKSEGSDRFTGASEPLLTTQVR